MEIRMKETKQTQKNKKSRANDTLREGVAYLIFGVLTTVIDYAISNFLFYIVHMASIPAQNHRLDCGRFIRLCYQQMVGIQQQKLKPHGSMERICFLCPVPGSHLPV